MNRQVDDECWSVKNKVKKRKKKYNKCNDYFWLQNPQFIFVKREPVTKQ